MFCLGFIEKNISTGLTRQTDCLGAPITHIPPKLNCNFFFWVAEKILAIEGHLCLENIGRAKMRIFQKHNEYGFEVNDKRENQSDCKNFSCLKACILIYVPSFVT